MGGIWKFYRKEIWECKWVQMCEVPIGYPERLWGSLPFHCLLDLGGRQWPSSSFSVAYAPEPHVNSARTKSSRVAWWCHCRTRNACMLREHRKPWSSCVKALQPGWVGTAKRKYSRGMEGELENLESLLQWIWPGLAPFLWAYSCSVPSLQFFSLLLCQAQNPVILTLLLESLQWQTKAPHRPFHPRPAVSKVTVANLETGLGPQTEDALRACSQSPRSFHSGQWKDRLFCDWTMSVLRGRVPTAVLAKPHCVGPHWCWETSTWRPCLGKQRHWWSCKGEENEAMFKQSGFSTIISNSASCFIKPTGVVGISIQLTVWTDLIAQLVCGQRLQEKGSPDSKARAMHMKKMGFIYFLVCLFSYP